MSKAFAARNAFAALGLAALLAAGPAALAASGVRSIMHSWKTSARAVHEMLSGGTAYQEPAIRAALQTYVADAGRIEAQVTGQGASAQDIRRRFQAFEADAQAALGHMPQRPALAADVARLMSDCQSCHDIYN